MSYFGGRQFRGGHFRGPHFQPVRVFVIPSKVGGGYYVAPEHKPLISVHQLAAAIGLFGDFQTRTVYAPITASATLALGQSSIAEKHDPHADTRAEDEIWLLSLQDVLHI